MFEPLSHPAGAVDNSHTHTHTREGFAISQQYKLHSPPKLLQDSDVFATEEAVSLSRTQTARPKKWHMGSQLARFDNIPTLESSDI